MICKICGTENEENVNFCAVCGSALVNDDANTTENAYGDEYAYDTENSYGTEENPYFAETAPAEYKDVLGLISFILGIVGLASCNPACAIAAIVLGSIGKKKAANAGTFSKRASTGFTLGIVGAVISMIGLTAYYVFAFGAGFMDAMYY